MTKLKALATSLPSMGGVEIGDRLQCHAVQVPKGGAIVEVGCWLGAGTAHLALGAQENGTPIHVYDRWLAHPSEVEKARRFGVELVARENTLPKVKASLEPFGAEIYWHRGDVRRARWHGAPIGLYVDDASKQPEVWARSAKTFLAKVSVGGVVVLMDYHFHETAGPRYRAQKTYMEARQESFELIEDRVADTTAAIFRRIA